MKAGGAPPATPNRSLREPLRDNALNEGGGRTPRNASLSPITTSFHLTLNEGGGRTPRNAYLRQAG